MKTISVRRPGQPGTKRLQQQFGDRLLCVRYRYDEKRRVRIKSVELIVHELPWLEDVHINPFRIPPHRPVGPVLVKLNHHERQLRADIITAGGEWHSKGGHWELPYEDAIRLGPAKRIRRFL
jgi:hypothetical protein